MSLNAPGLRLLTGFDVLHAMWLVGMCALLRGHGLYRARGLVSVSFCSGGCLHFLFPTVSSHYFNINYKPALDSFNII